MRLKFIIALCLLSLLSIGYVAADPRDESTTVMSIAPSELNPESIKGFLLLKTGPSRVCEYVTDHKKAEIWLCYTLKPENKVLM